MNALALGIVLALIFAPVQSSGDIVAHPGHGPRFLFCPGYRGRDPEPAVTKRKLDPLWLLQTEDEWIPFRSDKLEYSGRRADKLVEKKFFGCFIYHLAEFSHYILDFFFPYYGPPYYRVAPVASFPPSCSPNPSPGTSADCRNS